MRILFLFLISICVAVRGFGQNLVQNPSFEQYSICPTNFDNFVNYVDKWFNPCPPNQVQSNGTPDYFNSCEPNNIVSVPNNSLGFQQAKTGVAYAGMLLSESVTWDIDFREYISVKLQSTLQAGVKYYVSFYISLSDSSSYTTDDIGVYFSNDSISEDTYILPFTPQVSNNEGEFITNNQTWEQLQFEFIANGGENFLTIGNFKNHDNTDTLFINPNVVNDDKIIYCYLDDVCVSSNANDCYQGNSILENESSKPICFPNPVINDLIFNLKENFNFILSDEKGMVCIEGKLNEKNNKIDFRTLSCGVYVLKLVNENRILIYKITKNEN